MKCTLRLHKFAHTSISRASKPQGHKVEALASQLCGTIVPCSLVVAPGGCDWSWFLSSCLNDENNFCRKPHRFSQQANHAITYKRNVFSKIAKWKTFEFQSEGSSCCPPKTNSEDGRRLTDTRIHTQTEYRNSLAHAPRVNNQTYDTYIQVWLPPMSWDFFISGSVSELACMQVS